MKGELLIRTVFDRVDCGELGNFLIESAPLFSEEDMAKMEGAGRTLEALSKSESFYEKWQAAYTKYVIDHLSNVVEKSTGIDSNPLAEKMEITMLRSRKKGGFGMILLPEFRIAMVEVLEADKARMPEEYRSSWIEYERALLRMKRDGMSAQIGRLNSGAPLVYATDVPLHSFNDRNIQIKPSDSEILTTVNSDYAQVIGVDLSLYFEIPKRD